MPDSAGTVRYESPELRPRWFVVGLIIGAAILFLLGFALMQFYLHLLASTNGVEPARSVSAGKMPQSDAPPLQPQEGHDQIDKQDLAEMRAHESAVFDRLGWTWDDAAQRRTIPAAVLEAVRHRAASTQPVDQSTQHRGAE